MVSFGPVPKSFSGGPRRGPIGVGFRLTARVLSGMERPPRGDETFACEHATPHTQFIR